MKKAIFTQLSLFLMACGLAQPVLTDTDFPTVSYAEIYELTDLTNLNLGNSGANQVWDFSQIPHEVPIYYNAYKQEVIPVASAQLSTSFPQANFCIRMTTGEGGITNSFYNISASQMEYIGYSGFSPKASSSEYYEVHLTDTDITFEFPYSYGTTFSDSYSYNSTGNSYTIVNTFDAYGTLITPFQTHHQVIRNKRSHISISGEISTSYLWYNVHPFYEIMNVEISEEIIQYATILKNLTYLNNSKNNFANTFSAGPNPVLDYLTIDLKDESSHPKLNMYDLSGKLLLEDLPLIDGSNKISLNDFQSGIYLIKIYDEKQVKLYTQKIVKQ